MFTSITDDMECKYKLESDSDDISTIVTCDTCWTYVIKSGDGYK